MSAKPLDTWRVETPEGTFEADLETLKQWIAENCVLPTDKVARGNLHWIEAGRVPLLRGAFAGKMPPPTALIPETVSVAPAQTLAPATAVHPARTVGAAQTVAAGHAVAVAQPAWIPPPPPFAHHAGAHQQRPACVNHPFALPHFICRACDATFCKECPKYVGNKVPLCSACGDLCKPFQEVREQDARRQSQSAGFGINEFTLAIAYPFRHILSVLLMASIYAFLSLFGLKGQILACGMLFGSMSHIINQFAWGATNCGLFPPFESFSWWDNVIRPVFLSIGIYIIAFGPVLVLSLAILFGAFTMTATQPQRATPLPQQGSQMTEREIQALLHKADPNAPAPTQVEPTTEPVGATSEQKSAASDSSPGSVMLALGLSGTVIGLLGLALAWALFYYPMALTIAGYTEDFWSVVNPVVGLDTMRRMGWAYVKAFLMYICVQIPALILMGFFYIILSPFNLPFFGNLPAFFMSGIITFCTSLVIACILGFALFKSGDRLGIEAA
jgi:hypothetical protein